jgi:hypothetical protein
MKLKLVTAHPLASDSPDHLSPFGAVRDNSRNPRFNQKLYRLYDDASLYILDIGCAGGGFVKDCVDDGHTAFGIEGTDTCRKHSLGEWAAIPDSLFTCDASQPFHFETMDGSRFCFDVITAWEVLEHIPAPRLDTFFANVRRNLHSWGLFIVSVHSTSSLVNGVEYHQTIQPPDWWETQFKLHGFWIDRPLKNHFDGEFVRGKPDGSENWVLRL